MTLSEIEAYQEDLERQKVSDEYVKAELEAKAQARQAILDRLGLTEEEAKLLLG